MDIGKPGSERADRPPQLRCVLGENGLVYVAADTIAAALRWYAGDLHADALLVEDEDEAGSMGATADYLSGLVEEFDLAIMAWLNKELAAREARPRVAKGRRPPAL